MTSQILTISPKGLQTCCTLTDCYDAYQLDDIWVLKLTHNGSLRNEIISSLGCSTLLMKPSNKHL